VISRLQHSFGERRWLSGLLLLAFLCHQSIALSHDHQHDSLHSFAHVQDSTLTDTESSCTACAATDHAPASGSAGILAFAARLSTGVENITANPVLIEVNDPYFARAPPVNQQVI
jgi:hypothetical protein